VVHGREKDGLTDEFGVSGYLHEGIFIMFDRATESLWYPFDEAEWTAIAGPRMGETIPLISKPPVVPLGEWRKEHPNTVVLLGSKDRIEKKEKKEEEEDKEELPQQ